MTKQPTIKDDLATVRNALYDGNQRAHEAMSRIEAHVARIGAEREQLITQLETDLIPHARRLEERVEGLQEVEQRLREFIDAFDSAAVELNSQEIDGRLPDTLPHPWHEEWLYHARAALTSSE